MVTQPVEAEAPTRAAGDVVDRPHWALWVLVVGGLTVLAFQGFNAAFFDWWVSNVHSLPSQRMMAGLFVACVPIHVFEAFYVRRLALRLGLRRSVSGWVAQTLLLGYPSTRLIRKRVAVGER